MQSNPPGSCRSFIPGLSPPLALYRVNLTSWANMIYLLGSVVRQGLEHFTQPLPLRVTGGRVGSTRPKPRSQEEQNKLEKYHQAKGKQLWVGKVIKSPLGVA